MLEYTLKNHDSEIERLQNERDTIKVTNTHNNVCDECVYSSESETDLKSHIGNAHQHLCPHCNCNFAGEKKLRTHMCRIKVDNPSSYWFYTKDWFEKDKCIRVFDNNAKEEVVVIHSEDCITNNSCTEFPENFRKEKYFKDTHSILHLPASFYMISNKVKWEELFMMKSMIVDQMYTVAK
jgi:hypothetical protein